jgi:hypothetical protein
MFIHDNLHARMELMWANFASKNKITITKRIKILKGTSSDIYEMKIYG